MKRRTLFLLAAPLWALLALTGYELSKAREGLEELRRAEAEVYANAHREIEALRMEIQRSHERQMRRVKELEKEIESR